MKAIAVFPGSREIKVIDHEEPSIERSTQVKLQMLDVGICGTDKEICRFDYGTPPDGSDYLILGHESLGRVVEVGKDVQKLSVGDLAVTMVRRPCPHDTCRSCRAGQQDFCYTGDFTERGIKRRHGFMAEFVVDDETYMHRIDPDLRPVGVLVEPLTIAEKALIQLWDIQERLPWDCRHLYHRGKENKSCSENGDHVGHAHRALVLGAGPVGLLGAMALVHVGFDTTVYSMSIPPNKKTEIVQAIGANYLSAQQVSVSELPERLGNIDVVYEATGAAKLSFDVMEVMGVNSVFIFTGVPGRKAPIEVQASGLMRNLVLKNQVILGTVNAGHDAFTAAIADLSAFSKKWPSAVQGLITKRFSMKECREPLLGKAGGIKNVISICDEEH